MQILSAHSEKSSATRVFPVPPPAAQNLKSSFLIIRKKNQDTKLRSNDQPTDEDAASAVKQQFSPRCSQHLETWRQFVSFLTRYSFNFRRPSIFPLLQKLVKNLLRVSTAVIYPAFCQWQELGKNSPSGATDSTDGAKTQGRRCLRCQTRKPDFT